MVWFNPSPGKNKLGKSYENSVILSFSLLRPVDFIFDVFLFV